MKKIITLLLVFNLSNSYLLAGDEDDDSSGGGGTAPERTDEEIEEANRTMTKG